MTQRLSAEQWTRYWSKGTATTFFGRFNQNYDGEIKDFWHFHFANLLQSAKILDLGTGNGALAVLAAQYSVNNNKDFSVTAIDYAEIDPQNRALKNLDDNLMDTIALKSGVNMEATGLEPAQFDAVVSQFGFEYGNPERVVEEASRLLKPEGSKLILMMHHDESSIIRQANDVLQQIEKCNSSELHNKLFKLLEVLDRLKQQGKDPAEDKDAEALRHSANTITEVLHQAMGEYKDPGHIIFFLKSSMAVFGPKLASKSLVEKKGMLELIQEETNLYQQRMCDLVSSARSPKDIAKLTELINTNRFALEKSESFFFEGAFFGYVFCARR